MPKIILVNGPPRVGKDTAQEAVPDSIRAKFAQAVKEGTHAAFGLDVSKYPMDYFEDVKDDPNAFFFGRTPREAYISYSEDFMKPFTNNPEVFGILLTRWIDAVELEWTIYDSPHLPFIVTDSGFVPEAEVLVRTYGAENVKLIRVHREGCTFEGDSRGYINLDHLGVDSEDVVNDNIEDYKKEIKLIVEEFINGQ